MLTVKMGILLSIPAPIRVAQLSRQIEHVHEHLATANLTAGEQTHFATWLATLLTERYYATQELF